MGKEFEQQLQKVVEEWYEPVKQAQAKIIAGNCALNEKEAFDQLKQAMVEACGEAFYQLKLLHMLLLD